MTVDTAGVDARFAAALDAAGSAATAPVLGVEHEYMVYRGGSPLDFRDVIHTLNLGGSVLHPTDKHRYLTTAGIALMADGIVAEVATPPEPLQPGVTARLDGWGAFGHQQFAAALPPDTRLKGVSTHISVECPPGLEDEVAWRYAQLFSAGVMLLLDDTDSPGLLIRPRPSRIELGGEYAVGPRLRAATAFAAGSVLALIEAVRAGEDLALPILDVDIEPARRRFGWYVDRRAFGGDLYATGRSTMLRERGGRAFPAQEHLDRSWAVARAAIADTVGADDLEAADQVVAGGVRLPSEVPVDRSPGIPPRAPGSHPVGDATRPRQRDEFVVRPVAVTWDFAAFEVSDGQQEFVSTVPRRLLGRFLASLDDGRLDGVLRDALGAPLTDRVLTSEAQTESAGLFGTILLTSALLPRDRAGVGDGTFASMAIGKLPLSVLMPRATQTLITRATEASAAAAAASAAAAAAAAPRPTVADIAHVQPGASSIPGDEDVVIAGDEMARGALRRHGRGSIPGDDDEPIARSGEEPGRRSRIPAALAILVTVLVLAGAFVVFRPGSDEVSPASTGDALPAGASGDSTAESQSTAGASSEATTEPTQGGADDDDESAAADVPAGDFERLVEFFALHGSPAQRSAAVTYAARRPDTSAPPIEWLDGVSAFFFTDANGEAWVQIEAPRELAPNLCGEVDIITGRGQHVGDGFDFCAETAVVPWYFANVVTFVLIGDSSRVRINIRSGQVIVEPDDRVAIWILNASDPDSYEATEHVGQVAFAEEQDAGELDDVDEGTILVGEAPSLE